MHRILTENLRNHENRRCSHNLYSIHNGIENGQFQIAVHLNGKLKGKKCILQTTDDSFLM